MLNTYATYALTHLGPGTKIYSPSGRSAEILGINDLLGRSDLIIVALLLISILIVD